MRRDAKASFCMPKHLRSGSNGRLAAVAALFAASLALSASPAPAAVLTDRPFLFSFDGSDTTAGHLVKPFRVAVDNSSGKVYVSEGSGGFSSLSPFRLNETVCKFDPDGSAANFSATGGSCLFGTPGGYFDDEASVAVDNSGGTGEGEQGRIYVVERLNRRLSAFAPSGAFLWELPEVGSSSPEDVAVDSAGHPWVLFNDGSVREYANSGAPPAEIGSCKVSDSKGLDLDAAGNLYVASFSGVRKYVGCAFDSVLDPAATFDVFADQSGPAGHVFTLHRATNIGEFNEYDASGALLGTYGAGAIGAASGIAYSKALDRAYVGNQGLGVVEAFGPPIAGTVPDSSSEAPTVEGPGTATFHGTVNPQGVTNAYYFEWSNGSFDQGLERLAFRSPQQSLPEDSSLHAVSLKATNLQGNPYEGTPEWRVRVVALNAANGLRQPSGVTTFKTPKAAAAPSVTIDDPSEITPTTAKITGTVNPKEDSALVEVLRVFGCTKGAFVRDSIYLPGGEVNTALAVEIELKKLTPGAPYCVQLNATNSFGNTLSGIKEFDTPPLPPSEVSTAFAVPRTDTSARINGRVNPGGNADFKYRFEWSEDGSNWTERPILESSVDSQQPIVVADELTGLEPVTTYHYRLAYAENETGPATEIGGAKTFTTRTKAEVEEAESLPGCPNEDVRAAQHTTYLGSCRGIELVNSPDKGNQNVFFFGELAVPYVSPSGERALWSVTAGAPGSPGGVGGQFLAERTGPGPCPSGSATERTDTGWCSRSLEPPTSEQFGGGKLTYNLAAGPPDLSRFIVDLREPGLITPPEATVARLDDHQNEEVLGTYSWSEPAAELTGLDATDDGAHVVLIRPETRQLEDIGDGTPEILSLVPPPGWPIGVPYEGGDISKCPLLGGSSFIGGSPFGQVPGEGGVFHQWRPGYHMIATTDASLVYFEVKPDGECGGEGEPSGPYGLYVRDREAQETTLIDPGAEGKDSEFIRATPDGRHGYFLTKSALDPTDLNLGADLYRWDHETKESTCLTCVEKVANAAITPATAVMVSDDSSHAYFQSTRRLVQGLGIPGAHNIYVVSDGAIRFVAISTFNVALDRLNAKPSADGNVLLFQSASRPSLTADAVECNGFCPQLYRYDDGDGSVECLSCIHGGVTTHFYTINSQLSADGSTVGFGTQEALVPLDVNNGTDIYEWRNGSRHLITDGLSDAQTGVAEPAVRGIDADGSNILFSVAQPGRTGFELDDFANLYVARIGGGFEPLSPPVHCVEDSCQGPLAAPPQLDQPASSGASRGNVPKPSCPRGKVRRRGRCVKPSCARGRVRKHGKCVKPKAKRDRQRRAASVEQRGTK